MANTHESRTHVSAHAGAHAPVAQRVEGLQLLRGAQLPTQVVPSSSSADSAAGGAVRGDSAAPGSQEPRDREMEAQLEKHR